MAKINLIFENNSIEKEREREREEKEEEEEIKRRIKEGRIKRIKEGNAGFKFIRNNSSSLEDKNNNNRRNNNENNENNRSQNNNNNNKKNEVGYITGRSLLYSNSNSQLTSTRNNLNKNKNIYNLTQPSIELINSAKLAKEILNEQLEILEILENSTFLTNKLSKSNYQQGLTQQQQFIRTLEEVERVKQRYLSRLPLITNDSTSTESILSINYNQQEQEELEEQELEEYQDDFENDKDEEDEENDDENDGDDDQTELKLTLSTTISKNSMKTSLNEIIFQEMESLLSDSDDSDDNDENNENNENNNNVNHLEDIELELKKRAPSVLKFHRNSELKWRNNHHIDNNDKNTSRTDRYNYQYNSDSDCNSDSESNLVNQQNNYNSSNKSFNLSKVVSPRILCLIVGSISEWLVICLRSFPLIFDNQNEIDNLQGIENNENDRNNNSKSYKRNELFTNLKLYARRFLQTQSYIEKIDREMKTSTKNNKKIQLMNSSKKLSGNKLMSQSVVLLPSNTSPYSFSTSSSQSSSTSNKENYKLIHDDEKIDYRIHNNISNNNEENKLEKKTRQKGNILLLLAAMSFGQVVGEIVVQETLNDKNVNL